MSGAREFGDEPLGANITECPQAGLDDRSLRRTDRDQVERLSDRGDDIRLNQDYACMPQDEMSIAVNPTDTDNVFGGGERLPTGLGLVRVLRDDRSASASHGGGRDHRSGGHGGGNQGSGSHYDGIAIFPTPGSYPTPAAPKDHIDGGGDPIAIFDRAGTAYYGQIHFERENDTGGIFVNRSTNGGFTWSRPCIPNAAGVCGGNGDPRQPGDGVVDLQPGQRRHPERQHPVRRQAVRHGGPTARRRGAAVLHADAHARRRAQPGTSAPTGSTSRGRASTTSRPRS